MTSIQEAILAGDVARVTEMVDARPSLLTQQVASSCGSPLTFASLLGNTSMIRALLERGADLLDMDKKERFALHCAVEKGHLETTDLLMDALQAKNKKWLKLQVTSKDGEGRTLLDLAVQSRNAELLRTVLQRGGDGKGEKATLSLLNTSKVEAESESTAEQPALPPAQLSAAPSSSWLSVNSFFRGTKNSLLGVACAADCPEVCRVLISYGASVNGVEGQTCTPLMSAAQEGNLEIVSLLLQQPSLLLNTVDEQGWSALHWARCMEHDEVAKLLIGAGINAELVDNEGRKASSWVAASKDVTTIQGKGKRVVVEGESAPEKEEEATSPIRAYLHNSNLAAAVQSAVQALVMKSETGDTPTTPITFLAEHLHRHNSQEGRNHSAATK